MAKLSALLLLVLGSFTIAGCVPPGGGATLAGGSWGGGAPAGTDLKFCGVVQGASWNRPIGAQEGRQLASDLGSAGLDVSPASSIDEAASAGCDVFVAMTSPSQFGDSNLVIAEAYSPRTRRSLMATRGTSGAMGGFGGSIRASLSVVGQSLAAEFARGSALYRRVTEERDAVPAGEGRGKISKDEVREIVKEAVEAQKGQAQKGPAAPRSDVDAPNYRRKASDERFAVVVGVEKYASLPPAEFAERDAAAVREHLVALGYPERNVILLTGPQASRSGLAKNIETRLPQLVDEKSTVFFYFSGHGAPDVKSGQAYLVPFDGDPEFLEDTAYPLHRLYQKLGALKARRVIVALDSCFSGAGGRSVLAKGTRPLVTKVDVGSPRGGTIVLSASAGQQISGTLDEQGHGAFTYYLLSGLNGGAQNEDGDVTVKSLYDYLTPKVRDAARRSNRDQTPQLTADAEAAAFRLR